MIEIMGIYQDYNYILLTNFSIERMKCHEKQPYTEAT